MNINGGTDILVCQNIGVNGCLNIKNFIIEQVMDVSTTFYLFSYSKKLGGAYCPLGNNSFLNPRKNRLSGQYYVLAKLSQNQQKYLLKLHAVLKNPKNQ